MNDERADKVDVVDKIRRILATELRCDPNDISQRGRIKSDLGADSLTFVNLLGVLETWAEVYFDAYLHLQHSESPIDPDITVLALAEIVTNMINGE